MANAFPPVPSGIDYDRRGFGSANSATFRRASAESSREEIAASAAIAREAKD
jgi:hypothetical protein